MGGRFQRVGGFDESNFGGDKDFTWRAQLGSYRLHFAPDAMIAYCRQAVDRPSPSLRCGHVVGSIRNRVLFL